MSDPAPAHKAVETVTVDEDDAGQRLDRWFKRRYPALRHGELEKLLRKGQIRVEGGRAKASRRLEAGERVRVPPLRAPHQRVPAPATISKADRDFVRSLVLYEDEALIVLNKPFGLAVQGGAKTERHLDGLVAGLVPRGVDKPKLVHRLDRDTGGLIVFAKSRKCAATLSAAFKGRTVEKTYWALVVGAPRPMLGEISLPLAKRGGAGGREQVRAGGEDAKPAVSRYAVVGEAAGRLAWLALRPLTGRTHQLRVHCAEMGWPIVGDGKYGGAASKVAGVTPKLHLFARRLCFAHPATGATLDLEAPLHGHMLETWRFLEFDPERAPDPFDEPNACAVRSKRR
ncbi:MAG: RluA family pseudouridine synthase [Pseudomonadota bacterium]